MSTHQHLQTVLSKHFTISSIGKSPFDVNAKEKTIRYRPNIIVNDEGTGRVIVYSDNTKNIREVKATGEVYIFLTQMAYCNLAHDINLHLQPEDVIYPMLLENDPHVMLYMLPCHACMYMNDGLFMEQRRRVFPLTHGFKNEKDDTSTPLATHMNDERMIPCMLYLFYDDKKAKEALTPDDLKYYNIVRANLYILVMKTKCPKEPAPCVHVILAKYKNIIANLAPAVSNVNSNPDDIVLNHLLSIITHPTYDKYHQIMFLQFLSYDAAIPETKVMPVSILAYKYRLTYLMVQAQSPSTQ